MKPLSPLRCVACVLIVLLAHAPAAHAKAYFAPKKEMIARAQAIAVVTIDAVETVEVEGKHWTYLQRATARVEQLIKGTLPETVELHGEETFICARCTFAPGRYLVFLDRDGNLWVGSNWHLSARPIAGENVEWYADDRGSATKAMPLASVLAEVRSLVGDKK